MKIRKDKLKPHRDVIVCQIKQTGEYGVLSSICYMALKANKLIYGIRLFNTEDADYYYCVAEDFDVIAVYRNIKTKL